MSRVTCFFLRFLRVFRGVHVEHVRRIRISCVIYVRRIYYFYYIVVVGECGCTDHIHCTAITDESYLEIGIRDSTHSTPHVSAIVALMSV